MKLDSAKLAIATMIVVAVSWVICTLLVFTVPDPMTQVSGHMLHADIQTSGWNLHWTGFFIGLVLWSGLAGAYVWAIAALYNRLVK